MPAKHAANRDNYGAAQKLSIAIARTGKNSPASDTKKPKNPCHLGTGISYSIE